ncbi:hypothetical protein GLW08_08220 [Pontibacillus yanchengensis]|uniref:Uncharacterized protein n=1 Tax=Pontibacillus yanchengensis TaxID=462910 RepID=A0ACC7VD18_9BACI|nr:replication-relaxation family protein [Pontibacillus yanchengensis]MYL53323.1 hypothetical protein [Pontibacillus yanchengensis]
MNKVIQKEQREENILLSLKKLHYLSRSQLQALHDLGSTRNAQRILQDMSPYLSSFRDGENVYYLNKEGRERVNAKKAFKKTTQARHYLMRNSLYIAFGSPATWKNEVKLEVSGNVKVIADAIFTRNNQYHIIEVDHTQKMSKNRGKIERYKQLIELGVFQKHPIFTWITTTAYREKQLSKLLDGMEHQIFTIADFH